ncbi:MAG: acetoacetate decarboxylase family protein [Chitinophagaceae bacterium]|nr:acetoacetate decarboxylase family protein [Chitinophagaceae bacterium]
MSFSQPFFSEPQREVSISAGTTFLPCFFRKVYYTVCLFRADKKAVIKKLEGTPLVPALKWLGKYVVAIGLIRYDDCDLGQYNEMIVSIPVLPQGIKPPLSSWMDLVGSLDKRKVGQHIIHIPVTSEFSRVAGYELWGYPKIVAPVEHDFAEASLHSKLFDPVSKELIVEIQGKLGFGIPSIPLSLITYSFVEGRLMKTKVKVRGMMKLRLNHGLRMRVGSSTHAMANDLRMLGLDGKKPFLVMDTEKFQSVFYEARPV